MRTCAHCGIHFIVANAADRYCAECARRLQAMYERPQPEFVPTWRRVARAKDLTGPQDAA